MNKHEKDIKYFIENDLISLSKNESIKKMKLFFKNPLFGYHETEAQYDDGTRMLKIIHSYFPGENKKFKTVIFELCW